MSAYVKYLANYLYVLMLSYKVIYLLTLSSNRGTTKHKLVHNWVSTQVRMLLGL